MVISCGSSSVSAGWPFFAEDGLRRGSPEYYEAHAADPPGSRQKYQFGKLWPVRARPVGPSQTFVHRYHTAHYWPNPYNCQDRASVQSIIDIQVQNGWQTGTTFYSYHFDEKTNALNSAGKQHLAWLVTYVPHEHRQAYVAISADQKVQEARMQSVQQGIAVSSGVAGEIPVLARAAEPLGRPATEVQTILEGAAEGALPPVITYTNAGTSAE